MVYKERIIPFLLLIITLTIFSNDVKAITQYQIQQGDTLWKISIRHHIPLERLIGENPQLGDPNLIFPGEIIFLPASPRIPQEQLSERDKLVKIVNEERVRSGLQPCKFDATLSKVAEKKAIDMRKRQYIAHKSPTYGNPTEMVRTFRIPVRLIRENIGAGEEYAQDIFETWMASQIHRENLLEKRATHIGIGYSKGGLHGHYWTIFLIEKEEE